MYRRLAPGLSVALAAAISLLCAGVTHAQAKTYTLDADFDETLDLLDEAKELSERMDKG